MRSFNCVWCKSVDSVTPYHTDCGRTTSLFDVTTDSDDSAGLIAIQNVIKDID